MKLIFKGIVQGVGFRPTIYRVAKKLGLKGYVLNKGSEVEVVIDRDADEFIEQLKKRNYEWPKNKEPEIQSWAEEIDHLVRIDKREPERIRTVIKWLQRDIHPPQGMRGWKGWGTVILSPKNLREKWGQIIEQMKGTVNGQGFDQTAAKKPGAGEYDPSITDKDYGFG